MPLRRGMPVRGNPRAHEDLLDTGHRSLMVDVVVVGSRPLEQSALLEKEEDHHR